MERLFQAYAGTTFTAATPAGLCRIRVGSVSPELDRLLESVQIIEWAYITAWNPGSVPLSAAENQQRHLDLIRTVTDAGYLHWEGSGVPDDPAWTPERSVLILGMPEFEATALGRRFGQLAVVVGCAGEVARLVPCGVQGNAPLQLPR